LADELDRRILLDAIAHANDRWDWQWISYAAMSSHLHYGHVAGSTPPDRFFRSAHTRFAQRYHQHAGRATLGHVFASRPSLHAVGAAALPRLVAYHHRNPVTAGVVDRASQSNWTSHRAYLRLDPAPAWLDVEHGLDILGFCDTAAGRRRFDEFVMEIDIEEVPKGKRPAVSLISTPSLNEADWTRLVETARSVARLPAHDSLQARRRGVTTRLLVGLVAAHDFGQSYAAIGERLGMAGGSVCNLLARKGHEAPIEELLTELRRRLALPAE